MKKIKTLLLLFFSINLSIYAQQQSIDSLENLLKTNQSDTVQIDLMVVLSNRYIYSNPQKSIKYGEKALALSQKIADQKRISQSLSVAGRGYWQKGNLEQALKYFQTSLQIAEETADSMQIAKNILNIGLVYRGVGDLGIKPQENFRIAIGLFEKLKSWEDMTISLNNLGWQYVELKQYDSALFYLSKAQSLGERIKSPILALVYDNLGENYFHQKNYAQASFFLRKSLEIAIQNNNKRIQSAIYRVLAEIDLAQNRFQDAKQKSEKAISIAQEMGNRQKIYEAYETHSKVLFATENFKEAYIYKNLFIQYRDSLQGQASKNAIKVFEFEREQKKLNIIEKEKEQQKQINLLLFLVLFLVVILAIFFFRSRKKLRRIHYRTIIQKKEIEKQSEEILQTNEELHSTLTIMSKQRDDIISSINYALRIQNAIIPKTEDLQKHLNCFVLFRPRDIVSGDFYWFSYRNGQKILAVADCTGHGVSGAFVTMIGNNILNYIVHDLEIYEPHEILNRMPNLLEKTFAYSEEQVKDGMDIAIISIDSKNSEVKVNYAGAMNPLYYVQNQEFKEIKADKKPIGGRSEDRFSYQKHTVQVRTEQKEEDTLKTPYHLRTSVFYLCSDGFQDQFGGENDKKFMVKKLKNLLFEISDKPMIEQKRLLERAFDQWKGEQKQTDDVLVVGVRV